MTDKLTPDGWPPHHGATPPKWARDDALRFPNRPVFPQDPAMFDDRSLPRDAPRGAPWLVGGALLAFAVVLYCILVAEVR